MGQHGPARLGGIALRPLKYAATLYLLAFATAFWGPALGGIHLLGVSLYPARIFILLTWAFLIVAMATTTAKISLGSVNPWPACFLLLWLALAGISLFWTLDLSQGMRDLFNLYIGLSLTGLAPLFLRDKVRLSRAAGIWLLTLAVFLALAIGENITTLHLSVSRFSQGIQPHLSYRPTAVFSNENNFAVFINLSVPFLLARWRHFPALRARIGTGLALFAAIYILFVTGSRLNYIILLISILLYSLVLTAGKKKLKVLACLLLLVAGTWLCFAVSQPVVQGYAAREMRSVFAACWELLEQEEGQLSSKSMAVRINMLRNGALILCRTWGRGVGVGSFGAWVDSSSAYPTQGFRDPHNWWVELPAEYGIIIALAYLAFWADLLRTAWKSRGAEPGGEAWLPEALCLSLAILPLTAASPSSFLDYLPHWLLLALALAWKKASKVGS